jgi:hypothetical protein
LDVTNLELNGHEEPDGDLGPGVNNQVTKQYFHDSISSFVIAIITHFAYYLAMQSHQGKSARKPWVMAKRS